MIKVIKSELSKNWFFVYDYFYSYQNKWSFHHIIIFNSNKYSHEFRWIINYEINFIDNTWF